MKVKKIKPHNVPGRPAGDPDNVKGTAYDIKVFPASQPGRGGPFPDPTVPVIPPPPPNGDFPAWVDYFAVLVGAKLEKLNGLQFNLDDNPALRNNISKELGVLADKLKVGPGKNPDRLVWPLAGPYTCVWTSAEATAIGFNSFTIDLFFENEPDYRMIVNCYIEIRAKPSPIAPESSSSSYLATSSSG